MKRKVLAMLLLVALVLSAFAPAATAQPLEVQPLSGGNLVWTVQDQTVSLGTQYVDVQFPFENPGMTYVQAFIQWDTDYLRLPTDRDPSNVFPSMPIFGLPSISNVGFATNYLSLQWDFGAFNRTGNGYITVRFEIIQDAVIASMAAAAAANEPVEVIADVWIDRPQHSPNQNRGTQGLVQVDRGDGFVRIIDLNAFPMWFDANGGSPAIQPVIAHVGDSVRFGTLETDPRVVRPVREGYTFLGWARTADALPADIIAPTQIWSLDTAQAIVFAVWEDVPEIIDPIPMNFMGNTGDSADDQAVTANIRNGMTFGTLDTDPVVMRPIHPNGYEFLGWSLGQNDSNIIDDDTPWNRFSPRTVWAQWDNEPGGRIYPEVIAIAFYGNNNTTGPARQVIAADRVDDGPEYELHMADIEAVTRDNHTFLGWYSALVGGVNLDNIDPFRYDSPRVFFARWRADGAPVPMIFDANGGLPALQPVMAQVGPAIQFGTLETTPRVVIPTHVNNYEFLGWARTADALPADVITPTTIWDAAAVAALTNNTVFAVWGEPTPPLPTLTMNFMGNGGNPVDQTVVATIRPTTTFGTLDTNPVVMEPTRNGFNFIGWSTTQTGGTIIAPNTPWDTDSPNTVYAQWEPGLPDLPDYITLAFYGNGGTPTHQAIVAERQGISTEYVIPAPGPVDPERTHHIFLGWYSECGINFEDIDPFTFISPRVFFASWRTDTTPVPMIFDGNAGLPDLQPVMAQIGSGVLFGEMVASGTTPRVVTPQHPNNYAFLGWARTADALPADIIAADTVWNAAAAATLTNNTVFAVWGDPTTRPFEVEMNFMGNGGNPVDQEVTAFIRATTTFATLDTNPVVMEPTRDGHTFLGWSLTQDGDIIPPNTLWLPAVTDPAYHTVWAQWQAVPRTYPPITIAFYGNGNTGGPDHQAIVANPQGTSPNVVYTLVSQPVGVTRTNYDFLGWYSDCGLNFEDIDPFTFISPRVFRARWEGDTESMAMWFVGNGGNPAEQVVTVQVGEGVTFATLQAYPRVVTPLHPNRYEFLGWSTTQDGSSGIIPPGTVWTDESPRIVYAQWDPDGDDPRTEVPMNFRGNTGNAADDQAVMVFVTQGMTFGTLDTNPVVVRPEHPSGYRFLGWSRDQAPGSPIIGANTNWSNIAFNNSYRTVWAQWGPGPDIFPEYVEVAFHGNGGSPARQPILAELTATSTFMTYLVEQPYTPTRYGYTFLGWFTAPVDGEELVAGRPLTFHGQREFWAQWESNSIPMWFVGNGGAPENQVVTVLICADDTSTFGNLTTNPRVVTPRHPDGYLFLGWSASEDNSTGIIAPTTTWTETSPRIVYAQWDPDEEDPRHPVPMVFVSNNLTTDVQEVEAYVILGTSTFGNLDTNPVVVRPDHVLGLRFLGWSFTRNGSTGIIADDHSWDNALAPLLHPQYRRVYAQWGPGPEVYPNYIAIGFYGNTGLVGGNERQVILADLHDEAVFFGSLQEPVGALTHPLNLDFLNWGTTPTGGTPLVAGDPITYDGPRVFYAQWERFFLEFRFDGDNNSTVVADPSATAYLRIPVTPGVPIDWEASVVHEYIYDFGDRLSTGTPGPSLSDPGTLVQGWALWGWFDNVALDYGEANRGFDTRRRPMVGTTGWDLSDETTFVFSEADFVTYGNGTVIPFTAIFSLWGDADDNDVVDSADVLLINQWIFDGTLQNPHFNNPINLRAANVTVPENRIVTSADVLRINQYLFDRTLEIRHFFAVLGQQ